MVHLLITGLALQASPCPDVRAHQFDFWLGEWDVINRYRVNDRWVRAGRAWVRVFPTASGCAVVELWRGYLGERTIVGFSLRAWNPDDEQWVLLLNWPQRNTPSFGVLEGAFSGDRGDFFMRFARPDGVEVRLRYSFVDVTDSAFQWTDGTSLDSGATWTTSWIMEYRRRPATAPPVFSAVPSTDAFCDRPEDREADELHGLWESSGGDVTLRSLPIVGRCATMDLLSARRDDGAVTEALIVRSWVQGKWVEYLSSSGHPVPIRLEGSLGSAVGADGAPARYEWSLQESGRLALLMQVGADSVHGELIRR